MHACIKTHFRRIMCPEIIREEELSAISLFWRLGMSDSSFRGRIVRLRTDLSAQQSVLDMDSFLPEIEKQPYQFSYNNAGKMPHYAKR